MAKRYSDTPSPEVAAAADKLLVNHTIPMLMDMRQNAIADKDTLLFLATTYAINRANVARGL